MSKYERTAKFTSSQRRLRYAVRKIAWVLAAAAVFATLVLADRLGLFGRADATAYVGQNFRVVRVIDGDTIEIAGPGDHEAVTRVRLWGVDTPETVKPDTPPQHFGHEASDFTASIVLGKQVTLQLEAHRTRDKYGRLLAYVIGPDGEMLNRTLVEQGYAYADPRYEHRWAEQFRQLQEQAKRARRGLWKDVRNRDLPYYYRNLLTLPARNAHEQHVDASADRRLGLVRRL